MNKMYYMLCLGNNVNIFFLNVVIVLRKHYDRLSQFVNH